VSAILEQEQALLDASGAQKRDANRWGLRYNGEDSLENLYKSVDARLKYLDAYYSKFLHP